MWKGRPTGTRDVARTSSAATADRLVWARWRVLVTLLTAVVVLVGAGWLAHTESGSFGVPGSFASPIDPSLAEEAKQAREAVQIRARATSQPVASAYDPADLEAATAWLIVTSSA